MMMMKKLKEIFGVGEEYAKAVMSPKSLAAVPSSPKSLGIEEPPGAVARRRRDPDPATAEFLPERLVPEHGIEGVAADGSCWLPWREESSTGEKWYRRVSYLPGEGQQDIEAYHDPLSHDDDGQKIYDAHLILRNARSRNAARQLSARDLIFVEEDTDDE